MAGAGLNVFPDGRFFQFRQHEFYGENLHQAAFSGNIFGLGVAAFFSLEKLELDSQSAAIACSTVAAQPQARRDDSVAGNQRRETVCCHRIADCACSATDRLGDSAVGNHVAHWNAADGTENPLSVGREPRQVQGNRLADSFALVNVSNFVYRFLGKR